LAVNIAGTFIFFPLLSAPGTVESLFCRELVFFCTDKQQHCNQIKRENVVIAYDLYGMSQTSDI